jgi:hypothetical protein
MRIKKVLGIGALMGGLGIAAAACGPVNIHWETYPTGTSATLQRTEQHWWVNGGGNEAVYVNKDQAAATADVFSSGVPVSQQKKDGYALEHDAAAAARNPYPGNPGSYLSLMGDLEAAGQDLATGQLSSAAGELSAAGSVASGAGWSTDFPAVPSGLEP